MLLLLNEHGDPSFLFPNLSSYNTNNQLAKFEKKSQCRFYFSGMTLSTFSNVTHVFVGNPGVKEMLTSAVKAFAFLQGARSAFVKPNL